MRFFYWLIGAFLGAKLGIWMAEGDSMKKILIFILILGMLFAITGCSKRTTLDNGQIVEVIANFYVIKELHPSGPASYSVNLCYDKDTKVMYYVIGSGGSYSFGVSPYYLPNGKLGIYGVNYKEGDLYDCFK